MTGRKGRSGGARVGTQGEAYTNRTDLNAQPVRAAPSSTYGERAAQEQSQQQIPLAGARPLPPIVPLDAPSTRPNEHVMTGAPVGPGLGPEAVMRPPVDQSPNASNMDVLAQLKALVALHPNPGLIALVSSIEGGDYSRGGPYGRAIGQ